MTKRDIGNEVQQVRNKIEDAYRRLPIKKEAQCRLSVMVDEMANFPLNPKGNPAFDVVGRKSTRKELDALAKKGNALVKCLTSLHGPSIDALADVGFLDRHLLIRLADHLSIAAKRADVSKVPEEQGKGRPEAKFPLGIAQILAFEYQELTGQEPTRRTRAAGVDEGKAYGPFLDLVKDVFAALGVKAKPEAMAREAIEVTRKSRAQRFNPQQSSDMMLDVERSKLMDLMRRIKIGKIFLENKRDGIERARLHMEKIPQK